MKKVYEKLIEYRKPIGYVIGTLNVLSGITDLLFGSLMLGILWTLLGALIIADAKYN